MQYHLQGFRSGDPAVQPEIEKSRENPSLVDVLIVGCGPAGLTLATQLSAFPTIHTRIIEKKSGPLTVGQADGVACRSMEMFEAFGFADAVKKESYWVNEVVFWRQNSEKALARVDRIQDVEDGLSEMPHTILNQARIHDFYLQAMHNSARRLSPDYGRTLVSLNRDDSSDHPLTANFELAGGGEEIIRAKYVVGCDGARSKVRQTLGYELKGEAARQLWGVMDALVVTDFPDIRLKAAIQTDTQGSLLIIPREGGYMVRLYIEMDQLGDNERASDRQLTADQLIAKAQRIFSPYQLEFKEIVWWSAYEIGQRVCDKFDDSDIPSGNRAARIFIAGDACHTHSPKAGQGMNVSMADAFNLGWKLAAVLRGEAHSKLLQTYSDERQSKAQELIEFDRVLAKLFSAKPTTAAETEQFQRYFKKHGRYTAGVETCYDASIITATSEYQALAEGYPIGKRFQSAPVIRLADAKPMELAHVIKADGRWRLMLFAPANDAAKTDGAIEQFCHYWESNPASPLVCYTPDDNDIDSVIDVRVVFQQSHRDIAIEHLPRLLTPAKGRYGLKDYEKVFCANLSSGYDIFEHRGISREQGAAVLVRPDQFVAHVVPVDKPELLGVFFANFQR